MKYLKWLNLVPLIMFFIVDYISNEPYVVEEVWEKIEIEPINVVIANGISK